MLLFRCHEKMMVEEGQERAIVERLDLAPAILMMLMLAKKIWLPIVPNSKTKK